MFAALFTVIVVALVVSLITTRLRTLEESNTSLRELIESPEKYPGEKFARFLVVDVELREDPYHRLNETYYLVHIRDSFGNESPFVISSDQYSRYSKHVGENVRFRLVGSSGPGIVSPPDKLITNILVSKSVDPFAREFCTIRIALAEG